MSVAIDFPDNGADLQGLEMVSEKRSIKKTRPVSVDTTAGTVTEIVALWRRVLGQS